jgi:predicted TIM-barrel fold metal-dependent hydrolase
MTPPRRTSTPSATGWAKPPRLPPGSADCHVHVFDPGRFPFASDVAYRPVPSECGTADDLAATLDGVGIGRVLLVNPTSGYGEDNRCMLDAIERLGPRARGIARVPLTASGRRLDALARHGVVGVRLDFVSAGLAPLHDRALRPLLARLADRDFVLDVQAEADQWTAIAPAVADVPVRIVVDHAGRPRPDQRVDAPGFRALLGLADAGRTVIKLSGPMRYSQRPPPYEDVDPFVRAIVAAFTPRRLVWGSDWPFLRVDRRFDHGPALAQLRRAVPDARDLRAILVSTPARWFGFSA